MATARKNKQPSKRGGTAHHRPDCGCVPCTRSRNRKAKEAAQQTGEGRAALAAGEVLARLDRAQVEGKEAPLHSEPELVKPNRSLRARVAEYILLKSQGYSSQEIADKLGIKTQTLWNMVSKATREGILVLDDPAERLEYHIAPRVVDNIEEFLGPTAEDSHRLKMTIETAKGLGLFKSHQALKVESAPPAMALAIRFELPEDEEEAIEGEVVKPSTVIGAPKIPQLVDGKP